MPRAPNGFRFVDQPDLNNVSELICDSWARPCWNYDTGLLELHMMRPSGDPSLTVCQESEDDGRTAAFQAYMPFDVEYYGERYKAVFASFLTVHPDFQGRGLAGSVQLGLLQKAVDKGYDLYTTMCEVGAVSNIAVERVFQKAGLDVKVVNVLKYFVSPRLLHKRDLPETSSRFTREYRKEDLESVQSLVRDLGGDVPLRKIIPNEDIDFLFRERPHTKTWVWAVDGDIKGLINILLLEVLEKEGKKLNVYFENVSLNNLSAEDCKQFLGDVLLALQQYDYNLALIPNIGYTDLAVFKEFHFLPAPRQINFYIGRLKPDVLPDGIREVDRFYMDVY